MLARLSRSAFVIAALAAPMLASWWSLAPAAQEEAAGPQSRDAIWRAIFKRPAALPEPVNPAKAALGYDLFRDTRLSGSGRASCASCHDASRAFTDGRATPIGPSGATLSRNAPTLYNLAWATSFFWDGRAGSLSDQARFPILEPSELAGDFPTIIRRLSADDAMSARFKAAFPGSDGITEDAVLEALVAYERTLVSPQTQFDRWVEGDDAALSASEKRGFDIFVGKGGCVSCHGGWRFTDDGFHDVGLPGKDIGRGAIDPEASSLPAFKTPSLREVAKTAPYMHDGSLRTLEDVMDHYAGGLIVRSSLAPTVVRDLKLSDAEEADLVAFLRTISSK